MGRFIMSGGFNTPLLAAGLLIQRVFQWLFDLSEAGLPRETGASTGEKIRLSDRLSTYSTLDAAKGGLDLEMPGPKRFSTRRINR